MSTDNDPFASAPHQSTPGMLDGNAPPPAYPAAPTAYSAPPTPTRPANTLALLAIVVTGLYVALNLATAALTPESVERTKEQLANPDAVDPATSLGDTALSGVSMLVAVGSYVLLALWMMRIRTNLTAIGRPAGGPPAVEWWGWFVPLANFVLPFLGMRAISRRSVGLPMLLGWWLPFCAMWLVIPVSITASFRAIDLSTGELRDASVLDQMVPLAWATAALLAVSWLFLTVTIRRTTARHLDAGD